MAAQNERSIIRSKLSPRIELDELSLVDVFVGSNPIQGKDPAKGSSNQVQNQLGITQPFIQVNDYVFKNEELLECEIDATGFLPTVRISVTMKSTNAFKSHAMPKDGDIINLFIRAKNDTFKPIRNDYIITSVDSSPGGADGFGSTFVLRGELFIPRMKDEVFRSFNGSSWQALFNTAKELGLGFASNEDATQDEQVWICAGDSLETFMQDTALRVWKDENSFFKIFIDVYYHLNFINVNNQISMDGSENVETAILDSVGAQGLTPERNKDITDQAAVSAKFLTNIETLSGTNAYVQTYRVINRSSEVSRLFGYKNFVVFYDSKSKQKWSIFIDPIITKGAEQNKIILKGRPYPKKANGTGQSEDYWKTQNNYYWEGVQYKNVHDHYILAKYQNDRNLQELSKLYIEAQVTRWNPNIYIGEKIPMVFYTSPTDLTKKNRELVGDQKDTDNVTVSSIPTVDHFYSGFYMVNGMKITYVQNSATTNIVSNEDKALQAGSSAATSGPGFFQTFVMTRREWPTPIQGDEKPPVVSQNNSTR